MKRKLITPTTKYMFDYNRQQIQPNQLQVLCLLPNQLCAVDYIYFISQGSGDVSDCVKLSVPYYQLW